MPEANSDGETYAINLGSGKSSVYINKEYSESNLTANLGIGYIRVSSGLNFSDMQVSNGIGGITINITEKRDLKLKVGVGIGAIKINLPEGAEYSMTYSVGIGAFSGEETCSFSCFGGYSTQDYNISGPKIEIEANVGIGAITVS